MKLKEAISFYQSAYEKLYPTQDSLGVTHDLWSAWEEEGVSRPDVEKIHGQAVNMEEAFFRELVELASVEANRPLQIEYFPFCTNEYNCSAFTASDGYIVLVDDVFFQLLFMLVMLIMFEAYEFIEAEEKEQVRSQVYAAIEKNYFNRQRLRLQDTEMLYVLLKKHYDCAEAGNYLFQSIKAFILSHEIGHHVLGHLKGSKTVKFAVSGDTAEAVVDERAIQDEYEADDYGMRLFLKALDIKDQTRHSFFLYRFEFAPILFFLICNALDGVTRVRTGQDVKESDHPLPTKRIDALKSAFRFKEDDPLYGWLCDAVDEIIRPEMWRL